MKTKMSEKIFNVFNILILSLLMGITLYPVLHVVAVSFSANEYTMRGLVTIYPMGFNLEAYRYMFKISAILDGYANSFFVMLMGTLINLLLTCITAYPLAEKNLEGRSFILFIIVFTMMFNGGMIPGYMLVKDLGLINSLWALILPGAISAYNLILMRNFFQQIPVSLIESARIDGLSEISILFRIVIPLSTAALATIGLFYAVSHWNSYFSAVLYLNTKSKWPLQLVLRDVLINMELSEVVSDDYLTNIPLEPLKMATIVGTTLPILLVYPFLQKYFVKGVLIGSIKG